MAILLQLFWWVTLIELCVLLLPSPGWRRILTPFVCIALSAISAGLFAAHPSLPMLIVCAVSVYRIVNMFRIVRGRMHEKYLRRATRQTALWSLVVQSIAVGVWILANDLHVSTYHIWIVLVYLDLIAAAILLGSTLRSMKKSRVPCVDTAAGTDLPTLTVAIPARNDTDDLQACLESLIASDYPKLEVLVLDDCSQDKRTPEIIRSFAHAGVRFVQGEITSDTWLPKNQAYDRLLHEASGDYVLFCGVDVRFGPDALRRIIEELLARQKDMMSIVPEREPAARPHLALAQAMRSWWELGPPRRWLQRPPVMSSCWIIRRD